jgi:hypothetical protein
MKLRHTLDHRGDQRYETPAHLRPQRRSEI